MIQKDGLKKIFTDVIIFPIWMFIDKLVTKKDNFWAFPVHHIKSEQFIENSRAVFEVIKKDSDIRKIIFCRNKINDFQIEDAQNTEFVYNKSFRGLYLLLQCRVIFVTNSVAMEYSWRWGRKLFSVLKVNLKRHFVVNLSHGISLKKINAIANAQVKKRLERVSYRKNEPYFYNGLIASSDVDSYAMASMYYPIKYEHVWLTGLPRNDFLSKKVIELPSYMRTQVQYIKEIKNGRRLIVYAPTYRQTAAVANSSYYCFSDEEIKELKRILKKHNAVFGFRMHYFRNSQNLFNLENFIDNEYIFDLGHSKISDIAPIIREADLVISDYSSVFVEAMFRTIPVIGFAYDLDHYSKSQNGLLYDFEMVFPGPVVKEFGQVLNNIDVEMTVPSQANSEKYRFSQKFFYKYLDDDNSKRVVDRVKTILFK